MSGEDWDGDEEEAYYSDEEPPESVDTEAAARGMAQCGAIKLSRRL